MLIFAHRLVGRAAFMLAALLTMTASACNVPVFRYALEHWEADAYALVVFHRGPLNAEQSSLLQTLEKAGSSGQANLTVTRVDLAAEMSPALRTLWNAQENPAPPWMVVRYPRQSGIERCAWAGPLSEQTAKSLIESPARRNIARRLLSGDAVVWLLLESGNKKRDDEAGQRVEAELRKLEQSLALPERSPLDPPINPDLPLKIAFSTLRVARSDPAERMLVKLLVNWNANLATATEEMLFPIFGRGRVVPPATGKEIRPEAIREMAEFLTGPCSCEVKERNPGYDLLLTANWGSLASYQEVMLPEPASLVGISQFATVAAEHPATPSARPATSPVAASVPPPAPERGHLVRNLVAVLGIGVAFLAVTTLVLRIKASRRPR